MGFKICTIGCGEMATMGHGPSYQKYALDHPEIELAACCDLDDKKAEAFQQKFGFTKYYTDIDDMLDMEKPDAVCLVVPESLIARLSIKIMGKGYPLLMEKPPGLNREETLLMIEAAEKYGVPNQAALNRRHMPLMTKVKKMITEHVKIGELQNIQYDFRRVDRKDPDFSTTAIHAVDVVKFLAESDYKQIRFHYQEFPHLGPNVANIYMDCEFESGVIAQLTFCPVTGTVIERTTINALDHTFFVSLPFWYSKESPGRLLHVAKNEVVANISGETLTDSGEAFETNGFYAENASFFDDIRAGRKPTGDLNSAVQAVEIMECIRDRKTSYRH